MYAIDNQQSFEETKEIRKRIEKVINSKDFPMILIGNKSDLD
jgi:GTPase SAR1 family protein